MAALSETEAQEAAAKDFVHPAQSAESFPKSHQIFTRHLSNASSVLSDAPDSPTDLSSPEKDPFGDAAAEGEHARANGQNFGDTEDLRHLEADSDADDKVSEGEDGSHLNGDADDKAAESPSSSDIEPSDPSKASKIAPGDQVTKDAPSESHTPARSLPNENHAHNTASDKHVGKAPDAKSDSQDTRSSEDSDQSIAEEQVKPDKPANTGVNSQEDTINSPKDTSSSRDSDQSIATEQEKPNKPAIAGVNSQEDTRLSDDSDQTAATEQEKASQQPDQSAEVDGQEGSGLSSSGSEGLAHPDTPSRQESGSSLSPSSEPFVPSSHSSEQVTPRKPITGSSNTPLNANATAFVPTFAPDVPEPASEPPLKFGDFDHQEWSGSLQSGTAKLDGATNGFSNQEQEWQNTWQGVQDYAGEVYMDEAGFAYYQEADGSWVPFYDQNMAHGEGQWGYNGYPGQGNSQGYEAGQGRRRGPRGGRGPRRGDRKRNYSDSSTWEGAAVEILHHHFGLQQETLQEIFELHDCHLETVLDMLAQLEAESAGHLTSAGQQAPELTEENFPSLSGECSPEKPLTQKAGFAEAVKTAPSTPPGLQPRGAARLSLDTSPEESSASQPWTDPGRDTEEIEAVAKSAAAYHANFRNSFFHDAINAYLAGDEVTARSLGDQGHEQSESMKAAHIELGEPIYKHRGPTSEKKRGKMNCLLDFVGLSTEEALKILEEEIASARRVRPPKGGPWAPQRMCLLVGKEGRNASSVPQVIEEWLKAAQINVKHSEAGFLEITL